MTLAEWFLERDKNLPKPKWNYGDRVFAKFSEVPLIGMVIRQNENGVLIHADLPVRVKKEIRHVMYCNPKSVKKLVVLQ